MINYSQLHGAVAAGWQLDLLQFRFRSPALTGIRVLRNPTLCSILNSPGLSAIFWLLDPVFFARIRPGFARVPTPGGKSDSPEILFHLALFAANKQASCFCGLTWASGGMADARGLGPRGVTLAGSSPVSPTTTQDQRIICRPAFQAEPGELSSLDRRRFAMGWVLAVKSSGLAQGKTCGG